MQHWTVTGTSGANTAKTITRAAKTGRTHYITGFCVTVRAADVTGDVSVAVKDGTTVVYQTYFGDASIRGEERKAEFFHPIRCTMSTAANLVVGAAGASAITELTLKGFTV